MKRQRNLLLIGSLLACFCLAYAAGFGLYRLREQRVQARSPRPLEVFWEAWDLIERYFYGDPPSPRQRTYGAIRGALARLGDPYTVFVEPQSRKLERDQMRGSYGGIGVAVWRDAEGQMLVSPYPGSPAESAGVRKSDVLLAVDGRTVGDETSVDEVRALLHGEVGTPVTITLSRPSDPPFDLTIVRDEIQVPSVVWHMIDGSTDVGYIRFESFTERTSDETAKALQELRRAGASRLILDLRDNSGGLIEPAVDVADQFLETGVVLYQVSREGERAFEACVGGIATDVPLAVLVNDGTASAAEIIAGALQDYGRAPLIGEPTFGKGSVQLVYDLSDGSSLHVTSAIWLTPDRHRIEGQGLTPDIYVVDGDGPEDEQLSRAVSYLHSQS